jgi:acyl carrier protein
MSDTIFQWVTTRIAAIQPNSASLVSDSASIEDDLGFDSLDVVDLLTAAEAEFGIQIPDSRLRDIETVGDLVTYIEAQTTARRDG